ncbi:tyrosine-type recombinase/integrase [Candidatus Shapirobacteria bacterium]|nr:tyrosine-type recombinase/integrase [Candidatus Shapirobacteria bacterium]
MASEDLLNLDKATELFIKNLKSQGRSNNTIIAYKGDLAQLSSFLIEMRVESVDQIATANIEAFKKGLEHKKYTPKSISRKLNSVKSFFRFLEQEGVLSSDPSKTISHPKLKPSLPRILKPSEYRALRDASRHDQRATTIVELMLQSGLRIGEVANLQLSDIKQDELIIQPYESHPARKVPLNQSAKKALEAYLNVRGEAKTNHIFITKTGRALLIRNIRSTLKNYLRKSDLIDVKINDLRNTFITYQLSAGVPLDIVAKIVGHQRISTTEKYLNLVTQTENKRTIKLKEL